MKETQLMLKVSKLVLMGGKGIQRGQGGKKSSRLSTTLPRHLLFTKLTLSQIEAGRALILMPSPPRHRSSAHTSSCATPTIRTFLLSLGRLVKFSLLVNVLGLLPMPHPCAAGTNACTHVCNYMMTLQMDLTTLIKLQARRAENFSRPLTR